MLSELNKTHYQSIINKLLSLLILIFISSCGNNGCIEADDYGEYENQLLTIYASTANNACKFDPTKLANNTSAQGAGMINCLSNDNYVVSPTQTFKGCDRIQTYADKLGCFEACYQKCQQNLMKDSLNLEPRWIATNSVSSGNTPTITLFPDTEVLIKAVGTVNLGNEIYSAYIPADSRNYRYDTIRLETTASGVYNNYFIDLLENSSSLIKFYGSWTDTRDDSPDIASTRTIGPGSSSLTAPSLGVSEDTSGNNIVNGIKRVLAYIIPHPPGYFLDPNCKGAIASGSPNKESTCTKGVPLLPDPRVWRCTYGSGIASLSAICGNSNVAGETYLNFYPNSLLSADQINNTFFVSNSSKSEDLGKYGGFIRWTDDLLKNTNYDPFSASSVSCDSNGNCSNLENINDQINGRMIGDISSGNLVIKNNLNIAKRAYFKSLAPSGPCTTGYNLSVQNQDPRSPNHNITQNIPITSSWSSEFIDFETFGEISISRNSTTNSTGVNCGRFIAVKFLPLHDIKITNSGFVKFSNSRASGSCNISARIINTSSKDPEYYEYATATDDPLNNLNVPGSSLPTNMNWSSEVFIRKNQTIRFSPNSWNGNFATPTGTAQCGIGMMMYITPRPAVLCTGIGYDLVENPRCILDTDSTGKIIGCKPESVDCEDSSRSYYCPKSSGCQNKMMNCVDGSETTAKTGCTASATEKIGSCTYSTDITAAICTACSNTYLVNATKEIPKYKISNVEMCYDLENYSGRVSSITLNDNKIPDNMSSKGLKFLSNFNGYYGSFYPAGETKETPQSSNKIYQVKNAIIPNVNGRLIISYLDGNSFKLTETATSNNSGALNFSIGTSLTFKNGEWMEIKLCSDSGTNCYSNNPTQVPDQLPVVIHDTPSNDLSRQTANYSQGNYKFDLDGLLYRYKQKDANKDCRLNGVTTDVNSQFYCHTEQSRTSNDLNALSESAKTTRNNMIEKLRLSFKIKDPEGTNCYLLGIPADKAGLAYNGITPPFDGILIDNPESDNSGNREDYCIKASFANNGSCSKKYICVSPYTNNTGKYDVLVRVKSNVNNNISKIIGSIIDPFVKIFDGYRIGNTEYVGETERLYKAIIADPVYKLVTKMSLVIMISFYGIGYLMGITELSQSEIFNRYFKIAVIYLFTSEQGWSAFKILVINLFKNGTDFLAFSLVSNFDNSPEILSAVANSDFSNKSLLFRSADRVINIAFSDTVGKKISSFLFSGFFGWAYIVIFYMSIIKYVFAISNALMLYITAKFFMSILFITGPIFIIFILFNQTKSIFDKWLKYMISFSFQQIMITSILAFFSLLIYEIIKLTLSFKICWEEIWVINFGVVRFSLLSFWTIANVPKSVYVQAGGYSSGISQSVPTLFSILFIWIISKLMTQMIFYMDSLATALGGGLQASTLAQGLKSAARKVRKQTQEFAKNKIKGGLKRAGLDNAISRMDNYLFSSGDEAKKDRAKENAQKTKNDMMKNQIGKAGDEAVRDHKIKNAGELAKMSESQRNERLKEVRNEAMKAKGSEFGLKEKELSKLIDKKEDFKMTSDNALVNAAKFADHMINKKEALTEKSVDSSMSKSEMKEAIKEMSKDQRAEFIDNLRNNPNANPNEAKHADELEKYANKRNQKDDEKN